MNEFFETLVSQGMIVDGTVATDVSKVSYVLQILEDTPPMPWVIPIDKGIVGNS